MIYVKISPDFMSWRDKARQLLSKKIHYQDIQWTTHDQAFLFGEFWEDIEVKEVPKINKEFMDLALVVSTYRHDNTWDLLYRVAYRLVFENKKLLEDQLDPDVIQLYSRAKLINRDIHKMKAFVRFKEVQTPEGTIYMAWHNPDHRIMRLAAPFFRDRFNGMKWMIMTIDESASWDGENLTFSEGVPESKAPLIDDKEDLWKIYYRSIFNPARIKVSAMKKELPVRHWKTLPETELISELLQEAPNRLEEFYESQRSAPVLFEKKFLTLDELNSDLAKCRACGICEKATAPVPGQGPSHSKIILVGEQPGNEEDLAGRPFIGPAGKILNEALEAINLPRKDLYLTNAVKGFKFIPKDKLRWHRGANAAEIATCRIWIKQELELIKPETVILLGRSAAQSVTGKMVKIEDARGKIFETSYAKKTIILPHPASILRSENQDEAFHRFIEDWKKVKEVLK